MNTIRQFLTVVLLVFLHHLHFTDSVWEGDDLQLTF